MKLVRDRIRELAIANSQLGAFRRAGPAEYPRLLRDKLLEEAQEAAGANGRAELLEELGDVLQVLYALAADAGLAAAEIEAARARKARTHGTYTRRIIWQPALSAAPTPMESRVSFYSDAHLLLGDKPALQVNAWQHPTHSDSFTVEVNTADRHGRIAITGSPSQVHGLLAHMAEALLDTATAAGCQDLPVPALTTQVSEEVT
jgi:predicted house-cleaning noncanonical NTP pyrophosphatase (MazG superfamily)